MSDPDPTIRDEAAAPAPPAAPLAPPAAAPPTPVPAMAAAGASGGVASGTAASAAASARWTALGANGRLAIIGAAIALGSYILGAVLSGWSLGGLAHILLILGSIAAIVVVLMPTAMSAAARAIVLRVSAGIVAAYAAIDIGDLIDDFAEWGGIDIVLTIAAAIGGAILLVAAWRLTNGDVLRDASALARVNGRPSPQQLVLLGGVAVLVGWVFIRAGNASFSETSILAVLATVLALAVAWIARGGPGAFQLPVPANLIIAGLAALVAVLAAAWLINILDSVSRADPLFWPGFVLYLGGAAAMAVGAVLGLQAQRTPPPAPPA